MKLFFLILLFLPTSVMGILCEELMTENALASFPIRQGGRVKPLYVHARESLKYLTGKKSPFREDPVLTYCLLSLDRGKTRTLMATIEHTKFQTFLEMEKGKKSLPYRELVPMFEDIRREMLRQKEGTSYRRALKKWINRIHLYKEMTDALNWTFTPDGKKWIPISFFPKNTSNLHEVLKRGSQRYNELNGHHVFLELFYAKIRLPFWSLLLTLLALGAITLFKSFFVTLGLAGTTLLAQTILIVFRVLISGRAPITNMYETVLFSGYGALILALVIGHFKKEKIFIYLGLTYNACTLMMLNFADGMLSEEINPLVPVLRDNFWLSTHVTTVIMSYGALALSWVLANTVLFKRRFLGISLKEERIYAQLTHSCLKYGIIMLAGGIILGGIWADYSWGRFWGWDPKETGSLIALCIYTAILHGRHTNWIPEHRFMSLTALAFLSIMMAWFGVNYILASGLHSYGFSEGGAIFLGAFTLGQLIFLGITYRPRQQLT